MQQNKTNPKTKGDKPKADGLGSGYAVGLNLMSSVVVGAALGYGLDSLFGTKPWLLLLFLILGVAAGFRSIWQYMVEMDKKKD